MNEKTAILSKDYSIKLSHLTDYLELTGWKIIEHPNPNITLFSYGTEGHSIKVIIPKNEEIVDYNNRILDAIEIISSVENRSLLEIVNSITRINKDIFYVGLLKNSTIDSLDFNDAIKTMESIKKLIMYSASSEKEQKEYFTKPLSVGEIFVKKCKFGHTFRGSFGFTIEAPPLPKSNYLPDEELFSRNVLKRIVKGLNDIKKGEMDKDLVIESVKDGLNANMCDALLEILDSLKIDVEYFVDWSLVYSVPLDIEKSSRIHLDKNDIEYLKFIKEQLMPDYQEYVVIKGKVTELKAEEIYNSKPKRLPHIIKVETKYNGKNTRILLDLSVDDYRKACQAHMDEKIIEVEGKLINESSKYILESPRNFKITNERSMKTTVIKDGNRAKIKQKGLFDPYNYNF